jgi:Fe-S-cluster containining protein
VTETDAIREVRAVYADVEKLDISRDCINRTTCCHFRLTGKTPMLTAGEALVAAQGVRASGRKTLAESSDAKTGRCPLLGSDERCTIYQHRPFGCRTHFCTEAGGPYPRKAVQHLIHRLETIADEIAPHSDPRPLHAAVGDALTGARNSKKKTKRRRN